MSLRQDAGLRRRSQGWGSCRNGARAGDCLVRLVRYSRAPPWNLRIQYQACYSLPLSRAKLWAWLWVVSQLCCRTLHPSLDPEALS